MGTETRERNRRATEPAPLCSRAGHPRAGSARDRLKSRRSIAPKEATKDADLQDVFYGSDGTRTRDLRRDRPVRGSRRLATMPAQSLYSCGFPRFSRVSSAWLSEADFTRLLPVCCPARPAGKCGRLVSWFTAVPMVRDGRLMRARRGR